MLNMNQIILKNLNYNEEYTRKVLPFIKPEYFSNRIERLIFNEINDFVATYSNLPTYEALVIQLNEKNISDDDYRGGLELVKLFNDNKHEVVELEWLIDKTEEFCQERAIHNAVTESIDILDNKNDKLAKGSIPGLLSDALSVSFDTSIGHSYFDDSEDRYEYYHREEERIPFDLEYFNKITNGGIPKKTLSVILCPPHKGKTLMMCHFATKFQEAGKKVLYISCEMAAEEIARRVDANSLNIPISDINKVDKNTFMKKIDNYQSKTIGKMIIKEYPTSTGSVTHFRSLLNELKLKKKFVPDVIFVDYLNIAASSRLKMSGGINSYTYVLAIAQELRGLAQEYNVPVVTATQTTRCLDLDTLLETENGLIKIKDVKLGDKILSHSGFVDVTHVFGETERECYELTLESGKTIICSADHIFPTTEGEKNLNSGLKVGDYLFSKDEVFNRFLDMDKLVSVKKLDKRRTIDIEVSGDHLFYANGILTHNSASSSSDFDMTDISESYGVSHISDFMIGIINTEEMEMLNQIMVKQLKNRFRDFSLNKRFVVGVDKTYMRLYDVENSAQNLSEDEPVPTTKKNKFEGFIVE